MNGFEALAFEYTQEASQEVFSLTSIPAQSSQNPLLGATFSHFSS
jgi:hypothetical protein